MTRRYAPLRLALMAVSVVLLLTPGAASQTNSRNPSLTQGSSMRLGARLRSFVPGASGSLHFVPTAEGGRVRLTVLGLPPPAALSQNARVFVVWAVSAGTHPILIGELPTDGSGNGGLEFARPASFERYSVLVTAEASLSAMTPGGVMVLASNAGAVTTFYGSHTFDENRRRIRMEVSRRASPRRSAPDFFAEVDNALRNSPGGGRLLELFGDEVAPEAYGLARVATVQARAYVRAAISRLPPPAFAGANVYVMWAVEPAGRIIYMGSVPFAGLSHSDLYVRTGGVRSDEFDLFVTAEMRRPLSRPSGLRALSTRPAEEALYRFGAVEGFVVDEQGRPAGGVRVYALPADQPLLGEPPEAYTEGNGRFFLPEIPPGQHTLYAAPETEGYATALDVLPIIDPRTALRVPVIERRVTQGVVVRLGQRMARIIGRIVDAGTGQPIARAEIFISRADDPSSFHLTGPDSASGEFQLRVPPVPLRLRVSAAGYHDWYFGDDGTRARATSLRVEPNTTRQLIISLRPIR